MLTKLLLALFVAGGLLFTGPAAYKKYYGATTVQSEQNVVDLKMPRTENLSTPLVLPKLKPASKTITLESKNIVVFRGPVTEKSASEVQTKILEMSHRLGKNKVIYLVLNTPGGSVGAGLDLIDFLRAIPQKVHTITLFAASMGFQFAQNMDKRYITPNGTLMSHRARLGGLGGQLDGELESRYKSFKDFRTLFGSASVEFSDCPLIQAPLSVTFGRISKGKTGEFKNLVDRAFTNKRKYVKEYIMTGKHTTIFGL